MDKDNDKQIIASPYYSLEQLSEDSSLVKRGLRDLSIWPKIEELFLRLKELYKAKKIRDCINVSEEILKTDSSHFFTLCYYGRSLYLAKRYEESLKVLDRCLEAEKQYYFLWSFRGDVYYKMGKYLEAVKNYDESLKLELYEFWYRATGKKRKAGDPWNIPEFIDLLDMLMYHSPNLFSTNTLDDFILDVRFFPRLNEIGYFRKALFYLSTNFESYQKDNIGIKRAIEALQKVIKLNPKNWFAKNKITEALESLAKKEDTLL
ncbi:MAG TPA: tetratricopeptide repeat protein [Candidatus Paceibacterota bacterium]|nr:tetratricopeptide repeat protein [Candidatus Paceibacterota bacterium]